MAVINPKSVKVNVTTGTGMDIEWDDGHRTHFGFQWLRDDSRAPTYVFTSYGRTPAIAVVIDQSKLSPGPTLQDLEPLVSFTKPNGHKCLSVEDSLGGSPAPSGSPTPGPSQTPSPTP